MVMMLGMSLGVAFAGGLLGAFTTAAGGEAAGEVLSAFRWSFVCIGILTLASAAIFAQLAPDAKPVTEKVPGQGDEVA
jgi:Na+/H+ antiporter NhaC